MPPGLRDINHVFRAADWLAIHFQQRTRFALKATHLLALLMGLMYIAYSYVLPLRIFLYVFLGFFVFVAGVQLLGKRRTWHSLPSGSGSPSSHFLF